MIPNFFSRFKAGRNERNTIYCAKRLIGRKYDDPFVQSNLAKWLFSVIDDGGDPKMSVQLRGDNKIVSAKEISSMILTKLRETAESFLNCKVSDAVVTIPAYFSHAQRSETWKACALAGLNARIINEPTAAALAYGLDKDITGKNNILVYDLGGGTFDVSILSIDAGTQFEVRSTAGDTHLGGEEFDSRMVDHCAAEFRREHAHDLTKYPRSMSRLRTACEMAKRTLSFATVASIDLDFLCDGIDFNTTITRATFEAMNEDLFDLTLKHVEFALDDAEMAKSAIDEVVLVGGSTRIPRIRQKLQEYFEGKKPNTSIRTRFE